MTRCVGILGSESWTKCVAIREARRICFHVELSTHTQESGLTEHVGGIIELLLLQGHISEVVELIIIGFLFLRLLLFIFLLLLT